MKSLKNIGILAFLVFLLPILLKSQTAIIPKAKKIKMKTAYQNAKVQFLKTQKLAIKELDTVDLSYRKLKSSIDVSGKYIEQFNQNFISSTSSGIKSASLWIMKECIEQSNDDLKYYLERIKGQREISDNLRSHIKELTRKSQKLEEELRNAANAPSKDTRPVAGKVITRRINLIGGFGSRQSVGFFTDIPRSIINIRWIPYSNKYPPVALILNGPGQVGYYKRKDGKGSLTISQVISLPISRRGKWWEASVVTFNRNPFTRISGKLVISFQSHYSMRPYKLPEAKARIVSAKRQEFDRGYLAFNREVERLSLQYPGIDKNTAVLEAVRHIGKLSNILDNLDFAIQASHQQLDDYLKAWEEQLASIGDDAQLANIDLQNALQKQQQMVQTLSNISKLLHDTAMAIIRKIG